MVNINKFEKLHGHELSLQEEMEFLKTVEAEIPSNELDVWREDEFKHNNYVYNLDNLGVWWARLLQISTPKDLGEELINSVACRQRNERVYFEDGVVCRVEESMIDEVKQVVFPELAVESFREDIMLDIFDSERLHFSQPVVHYSLEGNTANVFFIVSGVDISKEKAFHYNYVVVCKRA